MVEILKWNGLGELREKCILKIGLKNGDNFFFIFRRLGGKKLVYRVDSIFWGIFIENDWELRIRIYFLYKIVDFEESVYKGISVFCYCIISNEILYEYEWLDV